MSFGFPTQPCSLIIGGLLDQLSGFVIRRPVFGALYNKAQTATRPSEDLNVKGSFTLASVATSLARSYAINSLLALTGARGIKSAAVVGSLVFLASSGPQLATNAFVAKKPWDVLLAQFVVSALETIGLAVTVTAVKESHGNVSVQW